MSSRISSSPSSGSAHRDPVEEAIRQRPVQVHTRRADHSGHEGLGITPHCPDRHRLLPTDRRDDISLDVDRYEDPMAARKDWVPGLVGLEIDIGEGETSEATPEHRRRDDLVGEQAHGLPPNLKVVLTCSW